MIDDELFFAYLDGELEQAEAARIKAAIDADPALAQRLARHQAMGELLRSRFDPLLDEPIPDSLRSKTASQVIDLAEVRAQRRHASSTGNWRQWAAMAATLIVGLLGGYWFERSQTGQVVEHQGQMVASGQLGRALDTQLASANNGNSMVRIGLTYRNRDGAICRSFSSRSTDGIACRQGGAWQVKALFAGHGRTDGQYRMASSENPRVMELIGDMIEGEPFDSAQEREAHDGGWSRRK